MYVVVNTATSTQHMDKEDAERVAAELGPDFAVYSPASDKTPLQLELLYALTVQLLTVGKINPLFITVELTNLLGETTEYTARQIVNDARAWIDAHVED